MPTIRKEQTAMKDRTDKRPRPQIPCPEVQPDPIEVPNPTRNPAMTWVAYFGDTAVCSNREG